MRALLLISLLAIAAPVRPGKEPEQARPLQEQIQGEWQVTLAQSSGKPHPSVKPGEAVFVFTGDKKIIRLPGAKDYIYDFTLDPMREAAIMDSVLKNSARLSAQETPRWGLSKSKGTC